MNLLKNIWKVLLVLLITITGWAITCWWNIMLSNVYNVGEPLWLWWILWFIEIITFFTFAVWFMFFRKKKNTSTPPENPKDPDNSL